MKLTLRGVLCALIPILIILLSSCAPSQPSTVSFQAMDTLMSLKVYDSAQLCDRLQSRIETLDGLLDATDENSEIFQLNHDKTASVSEDTAKLLSDSLMLCKEFDRTFDITVYPAVQAWGFTGGDYRVPDQKELETFASNIDYRLVKNDNNRYSLPQNTQIDLGAVAKGYAADVCGDILRKENAQAAVLNLGGTIKLWGVKPDGSRFSVGIADPDSPAAYFGTLSCDACTVATSGGYERYFEQDGKRYIHILDPKTAAPVDNGILSVTIVADSGAFADAASTALFVMGVDEATAYYQSRKDFNFIILTDDRHLYVTENIYDDFILGDGYDFTLHKVS